jgi:outer membrane protein assembly factor BamB
MRRLAISAAVAALLLAGAVTAYVLEKRHESRNIEGSSTVEFVPTQAMTTAPKQARARGKIVWPVFGYDAARTKAPDVFELRPPYRVAWTWREGSLLEFPPVIAYGRAYIASIRGGLFALDTRTGKIAWRYRTPRCSAASAALAGRTVYHVFMNPKPCDPSTGRQSVTGTVVALDARSGRVRWARTIGASESSPAIVHGLVYVGDWRGKVYAFDARTGHTRWTYQTDGEVKAGAAVSGRRLYIGSYDGHLYALDALTGRLLWRSSAQERLGGLGAFYATPAVAYGRVYVANTMGRSTRTARAAAESGGRTPPAATPTRHRRCGGTVSTPARMTSTCIASTQRRVVCCGASSRTAGFPARRR